MLYDVDIEASACVLSSRYAMLNNDSITIRRITMTGKGKSSGVRP